MLEQLASLLEAAYILDTKDFFLKPLKSTTPCPQSSSPDCGKNKLQIKLWSISLERGVLREGLVFKGSDQEMIPLRLEIKGKMKSYIEEALSINDVSVVG